MNFYIEWRPWHLPVFGTCLVGTSIGALTAWRLDRLELLLENLGLLLLGTSFATSVAMTILAIAFWVPDRRDCSARDPFAAEDEESDSPETVQLVDLARCWSREPGASILGDFLGAFDDSLSALWLRLISTLGDELGQVLPLQEQIDSAEVLGIWNASDLEGWRESLRMRTLILTEGAIGEPPHRLERRALWLQDLAQRTYEPVLPSGKVEAVE